VSEDVGCLDKGWVRVILLVRSRRAYLLYGRGARPEAEALGERYAGRGYSVELVEAGGGEAERLWTELCRWHHT